MRVFVYSKRTNVKIAIINNVETTCETSGDHLITFITSSGESFNFNTKEVKTTTYQN